MKTTCSSFTAYFEAFSHASVLSLGLFLAPDCPGKVLRNISCDLEDAYEKNVAEAWVKGKGLKSPKCGIIVEMILRI